ncbi:hypothetical protein B0H13DRAFT_2349061 [Mycena leptocephala]|nr:hypothetical protein B0H13DRAFT_2349061 [Mycena leptocephala]
MGRIAGDGIVSEQTIAAVVRPELDFGIALELGFILRRNGESGGSDSWSIVEPRVAAVAGTGNEQRRMHEIFEDDGFVFTRRVCRAVEEREIARVLLQQLGIDVQTEDESTWRREDAIALQDLVQIRRRLRERMSYGGAVALTKDRACVTETSLEKSSRTAGKEFNGDELMKAALAEISASTASCRDRSVGLWQETVMFGDELGGIRDELRTVQRQLKDIKEATTTRDEEIYLEMDTLRRRMQENRNSRLEDLRDGQENVGALHKEMRSEIEMVQDELRTIQRRLMAALNQQPWDSELAASFLQNWLRQEAQVVKKNSDGDGSTRKKRPFMPLLTKKLRKVLERAEMALQQLCRFPNRKDRHGKQRDMDESKAGTNTTLEGSRFAEKECSEDSELLCCDVVDIAHETQAD